jgi:hypothetical protein
MLLYRNRSRVLLVPRRQPFERCGARRTGKQALRLYQARTFGLFQHRSEGLPQIRASIQGFTLFFGAQVQFVQIFLPAWLARAYRSTAASTVSAGYRSYLSGSLRCSQSRHREKAQTSRRKTDLLRRMPAAFYYTDLLISAGLANMGALVPSVGSFVVRCCTSGRGFALRSLQTPSRGDVLAHHLPSSGRIENFHLQAVVLVKRKARL